MKKSWMILIWTACFMFILVASGFAATGTVALVDEKGVKTTDFKFTDTVQILAKVNLPKPISKYSFDKLTFYVGFGSPLEWVKGRVPDKYLNAKAFKLTVLGPNGTTDFPFSWVELIKNGRIQKSDALIGKVEIVLYKKIGSKKQTSWDDVSSTWITENLPIYDKGTVIAAAPFKMETPIGAIGNDEGTVLLPNSKDPGSITSPVNINGGSNNFSGVELMQNATADYPLKFRVTAFTATISKLPMSEQADPIAAIKAEFADPSINPSSGIVTGISGGGYATKWASWSPAVISGLDGEKNVGISDNQIYMVYMVRKDPVVVIMFTSFDTPDYSQWGTQSAVKAFNSLTDVQKQNYQILFDNYAKVMKITI